MLTAQALEEMLLSGKASRETFRDIMKAAITKDGISPEQMEELRGYAETAGQAAAAAQRALAAMQNLGWNAQSHGVMGDGVTDDAPALNALVTLVHDAGGGTIYLPKGVYMLDSPILWQSNVSLRGEGMGLAILKTRQAAGVGEGFAAIRGLTFFKDDPYVNCTFEQFTIDGEEMQITEYTSWPKGINIHFMSNCVFRDIEIRNTCATGLGVDHLRNSVVDHVVCINCGRSWTGNGVEQNVGGAGIGIGSNCMEGESLIVQNCVADGCGNYGIFFEKQGYTYPGKAEGHVIANNVVRNGRNHGIVIKGDANVVADGYYVSEENFIGKVIWYTGDGSVLASVFSFFTNKVGFLGCIVFPCLLLAGLVLQNSVNNIRKEMERVRQELNNPTAKAEVTEDPLTSMTDREYEEMISRIRQELTEELLGAHKAPEGEQHVQHCEQEGAGTTE